MNHRPHITAASKKEKQVLDKLVYVVGVAFPLMTIPQIIEIWAAQDATGLSLISWGGYMVFSFIYLLWAIADGIKVIIISQTIWLVVYAAVIAGIVIYG